MISGLLAPHRRWRWFAAAASGGVALAVIAQAGAIAWAVHATVLDGVAPSAGLWAVAVVAVVVRFSLQSLRDACARRLARLVRSDVRRHLRLRIHALGPLGVERFGGGATWVNRYQADADALGHWFARYLPARDAVLVVPLLVVLAAAALDWLAALLLVLSAPLIPLFMALVGMRSEQVQAQQQHEQHRMAAHFLDRVRALDLLRRSGALARATEEVFRAADRYRALSMRVLRVAFLSSAVMEFFSAVAVGLVAIYIGFGLLGAISFGPASALSLFSGLFVLLLAPEFFLPLRQFSLTWHDRAGALAAAQGLAPLLAQRESDLPRAPSVPRADVLLSLQRVAVSPASGEAPVVASVSFELRAGETIAVSGASGSGKSSLLATCAGFLAPHAGALQRTPEIAWIGQGGHLFHGTIRDNLELSASGDADDHSLAMAMEQAGLAVDDGALPDGLDTLVGEGRRGLSGGQAQRVAVARVLLSGAKLWLLDEPTRGLDRASAQALWQRLQVLARARSAGMLVATHDPLLLCAADRVFDIAAGALYEVRDASA